MIINKYADNLITERIEKLITEEFCCDLKGVDGNSVVFTLKKECSEPYIKIAAYRGSVIICASSDILPVVSKALKNKSRDEIFELPLTYGQTIHYVPSGNFESPAKLKIDKYEPDFIDEEDINRYAFIKGCENSLLFDDNGCTSARAAYIMRDGGQIAGIAAASPSGIEGLWELGVDVPIKHRNKGVASFLVSRLAENLLERKIVPFYSASVTNIASQAVAAKCGFKPAWADTYGTVLDKNYAYSSDFSYLISCLKQK